METNLENMMKMVEYIEKHLDEELDLDHLAKVACYSKYHLHRMFTSVVGFPVHTYVNRRRLTEAARLLISSDMTIIDIALFAGYETQRSFTIAFKKYFKSSPKTYRKKGEFSPLQLKYSFNMSSSLTGNRILEIRITEGDIIHLVGYKASTRLGFFSIGLCHHKLNINESKIQRRKEPNIIMGLNDYSHSSFEQEQPDFTYYAGVEVDSYDDIPKGMVFKTLPATRYVVFNFRGKSQDSLEPVAEYIYKQWFPQSTYSYNEQAMYDFAKYGKSVDEKGDSSIEYWIPIL